MSYRRLLLFIAIFLAAFGRLDLLDLNFGYLSVLPDLFGRFMHVANPESGDRFKAEMRKMQRRAMD